MENDAMREAIERIMRELSLNEEDARDLFQTFTRKKWGIEQGIKTAKLARRLSQFQSTKD